MVTFLRRIHVLGVGCSLLLDGTLSVLFSYCFQQVLRIFFRVTRSKLLHIKLLVAPQQSERIGTL